MPLSLPKLEETKVPDKALPLPKLEETEIPRKQIPLSREFDQRWVPMPGKKADTPIDFKSSTTPNRLPEVGESKSIKPSISPLQTSGLQSGSTGFVTLETQSTGGTPMPVIHGASREVVVATSLAPPGDRQALTVPSNDP